MNKSLLLLIIWTLVTLTGGFLIGVSCEYTSDSGPFNFNFNYVFAIPGVIIALIGYILTIRTSISATIKSIFLIISGLLIFIIGKYWMVSSKAAINSLQYWGESGPVEPPFVYVLALYSVSFGLILHGIILAWRNRNIAA